jgi:hypothetical protein
MPEAYLDLLYSTAMLIQGLGRFARQCTGSHDLHAVSRSDALYGVTGVLHDILI